MVRVLVPILILSASGCGTVTCLSLAQVNPGVEPIYGGVRTDVNCILGVREEPKSEHGLTLVEWIAKPCSVVDLPLSLAADTLTLPYAIWWTIHQGPPAKTDEIDAGPMALDKASGAVDGLPTESP